MAFGFSISMEKWPTWQSSAFLEELPDLSNSRAVVVLWPARWFAGLEKILQSQDFKGSDCFSWNFNILSDRLWYSDGCQTLQDNPSFPEFDVRYKLKELAAYLKIDRFSWSKWFRFWRELGCQHHRRSHDSPIRKLKKKIDSSHIYQDLKRLVKNKNSWFGIYDYLMDK